MRGGGKSSAGMMRPGVVKREAHVRLMGSAFQLIVVESTETLADQRLSEAIAEIARIEALLTEFSPDSQTAMINQQAGIAPVTVDPEVSALIQRCLHLSAITQGAFDISAGALKTLYNFKDHVPALPDAARIREKLAVTGYQHIQLDNNTVFLSKRGMRIGFGAVGKGYAADKVKALWKASGVTAGVINASGDLTAWGTRPDGRPWRVGIADPKDPSKMLLWLPVDETSIATSGNYEQFFDIGDTRYSHNIDPRSGMPVRGIASVTVISPSCELSDALATAVTIMGIKTGLHLIDQLPDVHGIIIDESHRLIASKNIAPHV